MPEEFMSFDEAREELGISEEELKAMIDEGKIRSFRDRDKIKFRAKDIHELSGKEVPEEAGEAESGPAEEKATQREEEALESIFGESADFDITPLEEDELLSGAEEEKPEEGKESPPLAEEAPEEKIETLGEEAVVEEAPSLKEEAAPAEAEPLEAIEEVEEIEPEPEEYAPIEEIEEKGEELTAEEIRTLAPQKRVVPKEASPFVTAVLLITTAFLIFTAFVIVNSFAQPGASYSIFEKIKEFFLSR